MSKALITGIAGGQGRLLAKHLMRDIQVVGVDTRSWDNAPEQIKRYEVDLRSKRFDNVFRTERPELVVHLGFVRHFRSSPKLRHQVNIEGTRRLLANCASYGVKQLVVVSSHYVYGAFADNPRYIREDHPMSVSRSFPEIRDLVEVEGLVSSFLWQHPEVTTAVLRPVNTLGQGVANAVGAYLNLPVVPTVAGFDPMMQFLHAEDLADAVSAAFESKLRGVFNVAGRGAVPLSVALRATRSGAVAVPEPLARFLIRQIFRLGAYQFPAGALDFIKYPCTVSDRSFREATGFRAAHSLEETFESLAP